jgi:hypothetical protein
MNRRTLLALSGAATFSVLFRPLNAFAQSKTSIPTIQQNGVKLPDFSKITFDKLPAFSSGGSISIPVNIIQQLGYDPSRTWSAGDRVADVSKIGDFAAAGLAKYSLQALQGLTGGSLAGFTLADFGLLKQQTVGDLVKAIPGLGNLAVQAVKPIADFFTAAGIPFGGINAQTIGQIVSNPLAAAINLGGKVLDPLLGSQLNLGLDGLLKGFDLSKYGLGSIIGLIQSPIGALKGAANALIGQIPLLKDLPFSAFLSLIDGVVGTADVVYGPAEARRTNTVTGSDKVGFRYPCDQDNCQYIELSGIPHGKQWVSGGSGRGQQMVDGGSGWLAFVNGGKEPTGRLPYGPIFKVVMVKATESTGSAEFGIYFRFEADLPFVGRGSTPYFIGPIPWLPVHEKEPIFLGIG